MKISDLPRRLKKRAKKYRKERAKEDNVYPTLKTNRICCAFIWRNTVEGHEFWHKWFHK